MIVAIVTERRRRDDVDARDRASRRRAILEVGDLELEVEFAGGAECDAAVRFLALARGAVDGVAGSNDATRASVVADGEVLPIR